jgi:hypothetical protein
LTRLFIQVWGIPGPTFPHSSSALHSQLSDMRSARLRYNNFNAILPPEGRVSHSFKEALRELADSLSIPINVPFENFVMPSATGPTRFTLPNGLEITITGPPFDSVRIWYLQWMKSQHKFPAL